MGKKTSQMRRLIDHRRRGVQFVGLQRVKNIFYVVSVGILEETHLRAIAYRRHSLGGNERARAHEPVCWNRGVFHDSSLRRSLPRRHRAYFDYSLSWRSSMASTSSECCSASRVTLQSSPPSWASPDHRATYRALAPTKEQKISNQVCTVVYTRNATNRSRGLSIGRKV